jgi:hypothetical protein
VEEWKRKGGGKEEERRRANFNAVYVRFQKDSIFLKKTPIFNHFEKPILIFANIPHFFLFFQKKIKIYSVN